MPISRPLSRTPARSRTIASAVLRAARVSPMPVRILLACLILFSSSAYAACNGTVNFASLTWESGQFTTAILRIIAERGYQCKTGEIPGSGPAQENALAQNDIQVIGEVWVGRSTVMNQALADGKISMVGDTLKGGARQGWYVPDYVWEQHPQLRAYSDLAKFSDLFRDGSGQNKPRFLNCPAGWTCEVFNTRLLRTTKLDQTFSNVHPGTGAALDAEIASAYEQKKPILFYYWQPTGLMAKYRFKELAFPANEPQCWASLLEKNGTRDCVTGFPISPLSIAVSAPLQQQNPDLVQFFKKIQFTPDQLNGAILAMTENKRNGREQAEIFLRDHPEVWRQWVSPEVADRLAQHTETAKPASSIFPDWSIQDNLNNGLKSLVGSYGETFRHVSGAITHYLLSPAERLLSAMPAWLIIILAGALAWHGTRNIVFALACMAGLYVTGAFGLWTALLQTLALLACAVLITLVIGIPAGIFVAGRPRAYRALLPVLDIMQTMPSFVYLIPVLMLFGLGNVPALFATVIYALAPLIRLTALGIRQISTEMVETGLSFGTSRWQMLAWVTLPLAWPSIMAGINQTVMMSLSMVVLASMIGAPGLGEQVLQAVQTLNVGQGVQAGGAIVILAVIIDRITQAYGNKKGLS